MKYSIDQGDIQSGDRVLVEGGIPGLVVCDFDRGTCLEGYEDWMTKAELVGGGTLSTGVMISTKDLGMVHYPCEDSAIVRDPARA